MLLKKSENRCCPWCGGFIARYGDLSAARTFYCAVCKEQEPLEEILFFTSACSGQVSGPLQNQKYDLRSELF